MIDVSPITNALYGVAAVFAAAIVVYLGVLAWLSDRPRHHRQNAARVAGTLTALAGGLVLLLWQRGGIG